jgi:hypothetical protein
LIAKSQPFQSQDLAINPEPSIPQNPPSKEEISPLEIPIEIKDGLFNTDFGESLNFLLRKRHLSEYNSNPLKKGSLRKHPKSNSYGEHLDKLKDGMSSEPIEGGPSHFEANHIFSPSMPTTDISFEPISKSILDFDDPSYVLSPESHDDPRNPLRHPKHRNHEDYKDDQEEPRQWLEDVKNSYAIEWMDKAKTLRVESNPSLDPKGELKSISLINMTHTSLEEALDKINPRVINPREILDIHEESTLELEKEADINEHGSHIMNTSSNPCSR